MIYKTTPWHSSNVVELLSRLDNEPLKFPLLPQIHQRIKQVIIGCLGKEEKDRWGWNQLFQTRLENQQQKFDRRNLPFNIKKTQIQKQISQTNLKEHCKTTSTQASPIRSISTKRLKTGTSDRNVIIELIKKKQLLYKIFN